MSARKMEDSNAPMSARGIKLKRSNRQESRRLSKFTGGSG